ncbi:MAG: DNA-binding NtrC family response regulator [Alphaproteobacteria bacterium]|jgi:DNA-binding NtrC family response regulator
MHSSSSLENKAIESNHHAVVLVVDDDPLQRGEIVEFISRQGIQVITEDNGFAAYHRIKKSKPRVIVMDMKMPGLDGIHVSRLVKNLDFKPKVILMSGYPDYVYKAHQEDANIFAVIEKPIPLRALARFITEALATSEA